MLINSGYVYLDLKNTDVTTSGVTIDGIYNRCVDVFNTGKLVLLTNFESVASTPFPVMMQINDDESIGIYGYPIDGNLVVTKDDVIKFTAA